MTEPRIDIHETTLRLKEHVRALTVSIGERSVRFPENLRKTEEYIASFYAGIGAGVRLEPYRYRNLILSNVVSEVPPRSASVRRYVLGAHYDSVTGTVGADDNASAVAVQLETARALNAVRSGGETDPATVFVSFALEEPPAFGTRFMGSRVYARKAKRDRERIDGMICLEMVGYSCSRPRCQSYPFPLSLLGYPKDGGFIGIVGNFRSRSLTRSLFGSFQSNPDLPVIKLTVPLSGWLMPAVRLSDHASFWDAGFKAVMVTDTAFYRNPHYHRPSDTLETLDYRFMAELVRSLVGFFSHPAG